MFNWTVTVKVGDNEVVRCKVNSESKRLAERYVRQALKLVIEASRSEA